MKPLIFDASAILTVVAKEERWHEIKRMLYSPERRRVVHIVNITEVRTRLITLRREQVNETMSDTEKNVDETLEELRRIGLVLERAMGGGLWQTAASYKAAFPIALGDAFGLAATKHANGVFVSCDVNELEPLKKDGSAPVPIKLFLQPKNQKKT